MHQHVIGESALIDKETGLIFWEGGEVSTLTASLGPKLTEWGILQTRAHAKAAVLSLLLAWALFGAVADRIRQKGDEKGLLLLYFLRKCDKLSDSSRPFKWVSAFFLAIYHGILGIPRQKKWFTAFVYVLYLWEALCCSTRRYLSNSMTSPEDVERYLEQLRQEKPIIQWKVRSFHYAGADKNQSSPEIPEQSSSATVLAFASASSVSAADTTSSNSDHQVDALSELRRRKKISSVSKGTYLYPHCIDKTFSGLWKRAPNSATSTSLASSTSSLFSSLSSASTSRNINTNQSTSQNVDLLPARFTKIVFSKLVILGDEKTRNDYISQQTEFVARHGSSDQYAEFSTSIDIAGFQPRILAVRVLSSTWSTRLYTLFSFWIFTVLGFTVPFRKFFSDHCDELRVTLVKEIMTTAPPK